MKNHFSLRSFPYCSLQMRSKQQKGKSHFYLDSRSSIVIFQVKWKRRRERERRERMRKGVSERERGEILELERLDFCLSHPITPRWHCDFANGENQCTKGISTALIPLLEFWKLPFRLGTKWLMISAPTQSTGFLEGSAIINFTVVSASF